MKRRQFIVPRKMPRRSLEDKSLPTRHGEDFEPKIVKRPLITKTVKVYKGWNKFFVSKKEAAIYEAKMLLRSCCNCKQYRDPYYGYEFEPCRYHTMTADKWLRLRNRIAVILLKEWREDDEAAKVYLPRPKAR